MSLDITATVSGMMDNTASYFGVMTKEQIISLFKMANDARQRTYESGEKVIRRLSPKE